MTGEQLVPATRETTWRALNDVQVLSACIPGCEAIEPVGEGEYRIVMTARVGPVSASFRGKLLVSNVQPPESYTLRFEGHGGSAGFGTGEAHMRLTASERGTTLAYSLTASVGGKLTQIGSRLIDAAARKVANDFFSRFNERLSGISPGSAAGAMDVSDEVSDHLLELPLLADAKARRIGAISLIVVGIAAIAALSLTWSL